MGRIRQFLSHMRSLCFKSKSVTPPAFENLEPRIMLSADSLLSSMNTSVPIDNLILEYNQQAVEYADFNDTNTQFQAEINENKSSMDFVYGLIEDDDIGPSGIIFDTHELSLTIEPEQVDDLVSVSYDRSRYDRQTGQSSFNTTIANTSSTSIKVPIWLVIENVSDPSISLVNVDGKTSDGKDYIDLSGIVADGMFESGENITTRLYFNNPNRFLFTIDISIRGIVDSTAPVVTVDTLDTNDNTPSLTGTVDDTTAAISVTVDCNTYDATNNGDGTWTLADNIISPALADGTYEVSVTATDAASNVGTDSTTNELTIDTAAPVVTVDTLLTNDNTPALSGTIDDPSAIISVTVDGNTYGATNNGDGTWTLADNTISPALADGTYDVQVSATDAASNMGSDSTTDELIIDTTAPVVTVDPLLTNDNTPALTGTVDDPTAVISVNVDGNTYSATNNGDGTWTLADNIISPALADGTYDVAVTATDSASNVGTDSTTNELTIDTTAPVVTVDTLLTNDNSPSLSGTVDDPAAAISVTVDGNTYDATNNGDGTWMLADNIISPALSDGTYDVTVTATDAASNVGTDSTTDELIIDTTSNIVIFEDPDLELAVRRVLQIPNGTPITTTDMLSLIALNVDSNVIDSLVGLEYAINLESLTMIPIDYSDPGYLFSLAPLSGLDNLEHLVLQRAGLDDSELFTLGIPSSVEFLDLRYNQITEVSDVANLPSLGSLLLYGNPISDLSALAGKLINIDIPAQDIYKATTVDELADALYNLPIEMYEYVLNTIEFEPYAGSMKGAQAVFETGAGNDWDTALLLEEMMANAGIATRYVHGQIEVPIDVMMDYLGVTDAHAAALILVNSGISQLLINDAYGNPVSMRFEHTWLEAEIYVPGSGLQWMAMDPSWKFKDFQPGVSDIASLVPFDEAGYLSQTRFELAYEYYADQVRSYLEDNMPGISIADIAYDGPILIQKIDEIPSSLPYSILSTSGTYADIPTSMTHRVQLTLMQGSTELFNVMLSVPDISLDRLTISFSSDGVSHLIPELREDGVIIATGPSVVDGSNVQLILTHYNSGDDVADASFTYNRIAGQYIAIGLDARQISEDKIIDMREVVNDASIAKTNGYIYTDDDLIGGLLYLTVMKWFHDTDYAENVINGLTNAKGVFNWIASGICTSDITMDYYPEQQIPYQPDGLIIDIANNFHREYAIDNDSSNNAMRKLIIGHNGSAQEHAIWEELINVESISTIKSLQLANERGIPIYVIDSSNASTYLPQLTLSTSIRNYITAEVNSGATVTVPRDETPLNNWSGVGFIVERGNGYGYIIYGGLISASSNASKKGDKINFNNKIKPIAVQGGADTGIDPELWDILFGNGQDNTYTSDPVNVANGNITRDETDFALPGIGLPLHFARHYDSQSNIDMGMGIGWLHSFRDFLSFELDGSIIWTNDIGIRYTFTSDGSGGYIIPETLHGTLTATISGFSYREKDGLVHEFDNTGKLIEIHDRNGNSLTLTYDISGHLTTVTDTDTPTRHLTLTWTDGHITSIEDFTGRTWSYTYAGNYLIQITSPSDVDTPVAIVQYDYYPESDVVLGGLLHHITEPDSGIITYNYYANRRGLSVTDAEGNTHYLSYNIFRHQTTFLSERGYVTKYDFDTEGHVRKQVDPNLAMNAYVWQNGLMTSWKDALGNSETYEYDSLGNLTRLTDRAGVITDYTYEMTYSRPTEVELSGGRITTFDYDANGNLIQITDPLGNITKMTYDSHGQLLTVTRPEGNLTVDLNDYTTIYTYNEAGQVLTKSTDLPSLVSYSYDSHGNRISVTDANGNISTYDYDLLGRLIEMIDPLGYGMVMTYDGIGNMLTLTDKLGRITTFEYDLKQQLLYTTHPDGTIVCTLYDPSGNLSIMADELGQVIQYEYDPLNRLIQVLYADGALERLGYDGGGRIVRSTDALGYQTQYTYDEIGQQLSLTDALGNQSFWTYDDVGNLVTITDPRGNTTEYHYDLLNRMIEIEDALNNITYYTYDANSNLETVTDPLNRTITYGYDVLDRRISETDNLDNSTTTTYDPTGNVVLVTDALGHKIKYIYDELNRLTQVIEDPDVLAYTTSTAYDAVGNVQTITDPENNTTTYSYDMRDRITSETNELGFARIFQYDAAGNRISATDRNDRVRQFSYDERNRQITETWLDEAMQPVYEINYSYDQNGNLIEINDPAAVLNYEYDALGHIISATVNYTDALIGSSGPQIYSGTLETTDRRVTGGSGEGYMDEYTFIAEFGDEYIINFESDDFDTYLVLISPTGAQYHNDNGGTGTNSRIELTIDEAGTWKIWATSYPTMGTGDYTLTVDDGTLPGLTIEYTYDEAGNRTSVTDNLGGVNEYGYDNLNRVDWIKQYGSDVTDKMIAFAYDAAGQLDIISRYADLAGTILVASSNYTFDPNVAGRLIDITHANGIETIAEYSWLFDDAGRIIQMTSLDGTSLFDYDDTNQLTEADHDYQGDENYTYDENGNRTNAGYITGDNNRLLSDGIYNYEYDNEGNMITRTEIATGNIRRFEWDYRNRLIVVTDEDSLGTLIQKVEFIYDALDHRIAKSVDADPEDGIDPAVTYFVYDGINVLLEFVDDDGISGPNDPHFGMRYFHGPFVDQTMAQEDDSGNVEWLLADHQGAIRDIIDNTGILLNHISYDSFGNIIVKTNPTIETRYAFTGREYDKEIDLYFYRARYYDAEIGRFINEDPIVYASGDVNLYRYVNNNPLIYVDPSGLCTGEANQGWIDGLMDSLSSFFNDEWRTEFSDAFWMNTYEDIQKIGDKLGIDNPYYNKDWKDVVTDFATDIFGLLGTNYGGGHRSSGEWSFPPTLLDTSVSPVNEYDNLMRTHDIEWWVNANLPAGEGQWFPEPDGTWKYYESQNDIDAVNDRVISGFINQIKEDILQTLIYIDLYYIGFMIR